ncbi:DUF4179 domain-containing protein [Clostridium sp. B9]|uniref:DUF4179 domain-containing protein n=1 Tax=Clostridium sp. B9 TaxID=3423224 RepID=UPI003D2EFAF0
MNKKDLDKIKLPENLDNIIDDAINKAEEDKKKNNKRKWYKKGFGSVAAGLAIVATLGIGTTTLVYGVPGIGNAFEKIQSFMIFNGNYSKNATIVDKSINNSGLKVTLSEILCDGQNLYVTYMLESKEPFKYLDDDQIERINKINSKDYSNASKDEKLSCRTQMLDEGTIAKVSFSDEELDNTGTAGLEGKYLNDRTFVGVEKYNLSSLKTEVPDEFEFAVDYKKFVGIGNKPEYSEMIGNWSFKVPVKVDKSLLKKIEVNDITENSVGVKEVSVTPFEIRVLTGYRNDNDEYWIRIYDEEGNMLQGGSEEYIEDRKTNKKYSMRIVPRGEMKGNKIKIEIYKPFVEKNGKEHLEDPRETVLYSKEINLEK